MIDLVIKNCRILLPWNANNISIAIDSEKIVGISNDTNAPQSREIIDAKGNFVLPGMIDMHTHFRDPGYTEREDFQCGTMAAAIGGVTTVMDMPNNLPPVSTLSGLRNKQDVIANKAYVDYTLAGAIGQGSFDDAIGLAKAGVVAFKTMMLKQEMKGQSVNSDSDIIRAFSEVAKTGRTCLIHAENENLINEATEELIASGRVDPTVWDESRPIISEIEAISRAITLARETSVHLHICHISSGNAIEIVSRAKHSGQNLTAETCPNYFLLTSDIMKKFGPYAKIQPPIRKSGQNLLWQGINDGTIDVIASDHAPYTSSDKEVGWKNIFKARSGGPGVETTLPLLLNCVNKGQMSLFRLIEVFSANPAKILGIFPQKGSIQVSSDADFVIVNMNQEMTIESKALHSKQKVTLFDGEKVVGTPIMTIVRGKVIMREGQIVTKPGTGKFISGRIDS